MKADAGGRGRFVVVAMVAASLTIGTAPASSGHRLGKRSETKTYTGAQAVGTPETQVVGAYVGACDLDDPGCARFELTPKDRYIQIEVVDAHGLPVYAVVWGPDGTEVGEVCGTKSEPIASPGGYVDVWPTHGSCYSELQPSVITTGEITATFSRTR